MSISEGIKQKLYKRHLLDNEIATCLINDLHCLDGDPQRDIGYQVAIQCFLDKQEECKSTGDEACNWAETIRLGTLIDGYMESEGKTKQGYTKKIAIYLLETKEMWLKLIPNETKDIAFRIVNDYLEQQKGS